MREEEKRKILCEHEWVCESQLGMRFLTKKTMVNEV